MKTCGEIIRGLREDRDLTQLEIANILQTSQQHYSKYETGTIEIPLRALIILADYYKVSTDYLVGRRDIVYGVPGDNKVLDGYTVRKTVSDILALSTHGRAYVLESIALRKVYEKYEKAGVLKEGSTQDQSQE